MESITTLNLLLTLGNNLVELLKGVRGEMPNQEKERELRALVHGMEDVSAQHEQIHQVLEKLKGGMEQIVQDGPQRVAALCTSQGVNQILYLFHAYQANSVLRHRLDGWDLLGVELGGRSSRGIWAGTGRTASYEEAKAYTRSQWTTVFYSGDSTFQEVVNCYELLKSHGMWKVNRIEIFGRNL